MMLFGNNLQGGSGAQFWQPGDVFPPLDANDIINTNRNNGGGALAYITSTVSQYLVALKNVITGIAHELTHDKGTRVILNGTQLDLTVDDMTGLQQKRCETNIGINYKQTSIDEAGNQIRELLNTSGKFFIYNGSDLFVIDKSGSLGTNQTVPFTIPLSTAVTVARMKIYDQTGTFVGYIPII